MLVYNRIKILLRVKLILSVLIAVSILAIQYIPLRVMAADVMEDALSDANDELDILLQDDFEPRVPRDIARELSTLSPIEIRQYPITDLSAEDIKLVLRLLTPPNLAKVLLNIPQQDVVEIRNMISPDEFSIALNRLPETDRLQIQSRFSSTVITVP